MSRISFIAIDGKRYRWKDILEIRRTQLAAAYADPAAQMALFEALHDDHRPSNERIAAGRYQQSNLFERGV